MKDEEKKILLTDLCARLPYGVKVFLEETDEVEEVFCLHLRQEAVYTQNLESKSGTTLCPIEKIKPFLRPMSSMTEEEIIHLNEITHEFSKIFFSAKSIEDRKKATFEHHSKRIDYLNSIFIDYRGLIPMGLALEAKEGMYNLQ